MTNEELDIMIERGLNRWEQVSEYQNEIIREYGNMSKDMTNFWNKFLHSWSNNDWVEMLLALETILEHQPEHFTSKHIYDIEEATKILAQYKDTLPRVMDIKAEGMEHKRIAWAVVNDMREIWNSLTNQTITNQTKTSLSRSQAAKLSTKGFQ